MLKTLNDGKLTETATNEPEDPPKKQRAKRPNADEKHDEKPKRGRKKRTAKVMEADSDSEPEYVSRKTVRTRNVEETVDPAVTNIEALATAIRKNAGGG